MVSDNLDDFVRHRRTVQHGLGDPRADRWNLNGDDTDIRESLEVLLEEAQVGVKTDSNAMDEQDRNVLV